MFPVWFYLLLPVLSLQQLQKRQCYLCLVVLPFNQLNRKLVVLNGFLPASVYLQVVAMHISQFLPALATLKVDFDHFLEAFSGQV